MIDLKKLKELGVHQSGKKLWIQAEDVVLLLDQLEAAQRDAARYRVFRSNEDGVSVACTWNGNTGATPYINGNELDECADSWIAIEEKNSSKA